MRTFGREDWEQAQAAWSDFSDEWGPFREQAARRGMLYPPTGTRWDSWDEDHPSQRAILVRAIRETPALLSQCIARSSSWTQVVGSLTGERDAWRRRMADSPCGVKVDPQNAGAILQAAMAGAISHRAAQLEAIASTARDVVRLANQQGLDDEEWEAALITLEGLLLALGDDQ